MMIDKLLPSRRDIADVFLWSTYADFDAFIVRRDLDPTLVSCISLISSDAEQQLQTD
jgi:hypothetical protein